MSAKRANIVFRKRVGVSQKVWKFHIVLLNLNAKRLRGMSAEPTTASWSSDAVWSIQFIALWIHPPTHVHTLDHWYELLRCLVVRPTSLQLIHHGFSGAQSITYTGTQFHWLIPLTDIIERCGLWARIHIHTISTLFFCRPGVKHMHTRTG